MNFLRATVRTVVNLFRHDDSPKRDCDTSKLELLEGGNYYGPPDKVTVPYGFLESENSPVPDLTCVYFPEKPLELPQFPTQMTTAIYIPRKK